jgi:hypothetical protein
VTKLGKCGALNINTKHLSLNNGNNDKSDKIISDRELIRRQIETANSYIMSIEYKLNNPTYREGWSEYFPKYILELIYDEAIKWIIFNHITTNQLYVQDKQECIINLLYKYSDIESDFKSDEFKQNVKFWVQELIVKLVQTKESYITMKQENSK